MALSEPLLWSPSILILLTTTLLNHYIHFQHLGHSASCRVLISPPITIGSLLPSLLLTWMFSLLPQGSLCFSPCSWFWVIHPSSTTLSFIPVNPKPKISLYIPVHFSWCPEYFIKGNKRVQRERKPPPFQVSACLCLQAPCLSSLLPWHRRVLPLSQADLSLPINFIRNSPHVQPC